MKSFSSLTGVSGNKRLSYRCLSVFPVAGAILALLTCGCSTIGRKVEPNKLAQVRISVTTRAEAESLLGKPKFVWHDQGETTLIYSYVRMHDPVGDVAMVAVVVSPVASLIPLLAGHNRITREQTFISLDTGDRVKEIETSTGSEEVSSGLLAKDGKPRCDIEKIKQIKLGETTLSQVQTLLGTPVSIMQIHSKSNVIIGFLCETHTPYERLAVVIGQDGRAHEIRMRLKDTYVLMKRRMDETKLLQIKQGQTTRDTVESLLGTPCEIRERGDGTVVLNYIHIKPPQRVDIAIGADQRVTGVTRGPLPYYY